MKAKYKKLKDGQWSSLIKNRPGYGFVHRLRCCDCGLKHLVQVQVSKKGMIFRAWREK